MIQFDRKGADVSANVSIIGWTFHFAYACGSEWAASLLFQKLRDVLFARIQSVRQEAYAQGWTDAKSKHPKKTWFPGVLN